MMNFSFYSNKRSVVTPILEILAGILVVCLAIFQMDAITAIICVFIGIFICLFNLLQLLMLQNQYKLTKDKRLIAPMVLSGASAIFGLVFAFSPDSMIISILFFAVLIVAPIFRLIEAKENWRLQLKIELPIIIAGLLILFKLVEVIFKYVLIFYGALIAIYGVIKLIQAIYYNRKSHDDEDFTSGMFSDENLIGSDKKSDSIDAEFRDL